MDNIEQDPQGEVDVASSGGQSAEVDTQKPVEVKTKDESEVKTNNETVDKTETGKSTNPWDDNPKFEGKSPEDVYKAYQELEKAQGTLGQKAEVANLIQDKFGITPEQLKERIEAQEQQVQEQQYEENPNSYLQDRLAKQENELALIKEERELDNFLKENPDYAPHKDKLMKIALNIERDKSYEDIANEYIGDAIKTGQQSAYNKIEQKQETQAAGSTNAEVQKPNLEDLSVEEMEKILPHAE